MTTAPPGAGTGAFAGDSGPVKEPDATELVILTGMSGAG